MYEICGTLKIGGLVQKLLASKSEAIEYGQSHCDSFEVLDEQLSQVHVEYPHPEFVLR